MLVLIAKLPDPVRISNGPLAELLLIVIPVAPGVMGIEVALRFSEAVEELPIVIGPV